MSSRAAFVSGTVLSTAVTCAWSYALDAIAGPIPAPRLGPDPVADYIRLADAAGGSGIALFAVIATIYFLCFLASGLRQIRRDAVEDFDPEPEQLAGDRW